MSMQMMQNTSQQSMKKQKTKEDYSRNVKKLKYKLDKISNQIELYEKKIKRLQNTSNDQVIAMKISKFCKERKFTPEMLFRFADSKFQKIITRTQFRNTLMAVGLKLSQQQFTRLQYLLDEDIKGDISLLQYSKYLHAFGLKQEYSTDDPFVKDTLQKIDFNKMLDIAKSDLSKQKKKSGHKNLLNYEEFLKYCHKNFPEFTDKQLGIIFNKLSRDNMVDLDDLIDYIRNQKDQQQRINRKNNKQKEKERQKQKKKQESTQDFLKQQEEILDINSLKGKIMAVIKDHPEQQQSFHISEFKRVQKSFNLQRGTMVNIFKQMDMKILGSIGYNQMIIYYVEKQTYKPKNEINVKYAFILMGKKMQSRGQKPEALVEAYAKNQNQITFDEFKKLCSNQFELKDDLAKSLYELMLNSPGARTKDNNVSTKFLLSLMKFIRRGIKNNFRPFIQEKFRPFMYKKYYQTICNNGLVTFKICRSIVDQLSKVQEGHKKWDDPQFGPTNQDPSGIDSIGENSSNPNVRWLRTSTSKANEFYIPNSGNKDKIYEVTSLCQNQIFYKSLDAIIKYHPQVLCRQNNQIVKQNKKVQQTELIKLFEGLHPLIFHQFQAWGIYVIQFFIKNKWVYVIVDDKIPCDENLKPLFATSLKGTGSYVSLIQKAYAKLKGSYEKIYQSPNLKRYIYELSGLLAYQINLKDSQNDTQNEKLWSRIFSEANISSQLQEYQKSKENKFSNQSLYLVNQSFCDVKARQDEMSGLKVDFPIQIYFSTELKTQKSQNQTQRLTFLNCLYQMNEQSIWNKKWHIDSKRWKQNSGQIKSQINKWDNGNQSKKIYKNGTFNTCVIDFDLMNQMFNTFLVMKKIVFDDQDKAIVLRKELEFQKNFSCHYKINSTNQSKNVKLIVLLNKIRAPADAKISIQLKNQIVTKDQQNQNKSQNFLFRSDFGCYCFDFSTQQKDLEIKVLNFDSSEQYVYQLSFYFDHPRYSLKERDRQLLFRFVSLYQERSKLDFDILTEEEKKYFYQNYFPNAGRKGFLCC